MTPSWTADERRFKEAFDRIERRIEERYQLRVMISDVLDPNTGDFDGVSIKLDYTNDLEIGLFVLAHLFGHTAQWCHDERARWLGSEFANKPPTTEALFEEIRIYERDASRLALQLFHDAGVVELDQWLSDWARADWLYLENFYRTGERVDFRRYYKRGTERLTPLPIPPFTPDRWLSRFSF